MARYRDKATGRFVSANTWKRSKAHGGTRYVRVQTVKQKSATKRKTIAPVQKPSQSAPEFSEYVLHFDYGNKKDHNSIRYQVHLFGPAGAPDREIIAAAREYGQSGSTPSGWEARKIEWKHPGRREWRDETIPPEKPALTDGVAKISHRRNRQ